VNRTQTGENRLRIGVSACLLGHHVRYDGGHKRDEFVTETLSRFVEYVPICPEFELGLGVPRETLRLARRDGEVHLIANQSQTDYTAAMRQYAERRLNDLAAENLSGYILKKNYPSCGMDAITVADQRRLGRGLFAEALMCRWPNLPLEEEDRLGDPRIRENFIERVLAYRRVRCFLNRWTPAGLRQFHSVHELQLKAHSATAYGRLGRLISAGISRRELASQYEAGFMRALSIPAPSARHELVLQRMLDRMRTYLESAAVDELRKAISEYRAGSVPLSVPIRLVHELAVRFDIDDLKTQTYLELPLAELRQASQPRSGFLSAV
jgi:uncharacterized protein YbbK (DUF523 family)/uncharacterized protein YbgA (DUF1722 family)